jgi:outer membrane protein assembly factor BamB
MSKAARNSLLIGAAVWLATCSALLGQDGPIVAINELLGRDLALLKQADERLRNGVGGEALDILLPLAEEQGEKLVPLLETTETYQFTTYITLREAILRRLAKHGNAAAELRKRRGENESTDLATPGRLHFGVLNRMTSDAWLARADELTRLGKWNDARDYLTSFAASDFSFDLGTPEGPALHGKREAEKLARLAYISVLEGSPKRAKGERDRFASQFGQARIRIAGRDEIALERIDLWVAELSKQATPKRKLSGSHLGFEIEPKGPPIWRRDLEKTVDNATLPRAIGAFPLFSGEQLFVSTGNEIYSWPLNNPGEQSGPWPAPLYRATIKPDRGPAPLEPPRAMLSESEGFVFARLGASITRKRSAVPSGDHAPAVLAVFDASRGGTLLAGFPLSPGLEEEFDGPPLVQDGKMFVAIRKRDEMRTQSIVRCIDVASLKVIWEKSICNAETRGRGLRDEAIQTTLVLDGQRLYVAPQMGCVACLDASSGAMRWLMKYPRAAFPTSDAPETSRWQRGLGGALLRGDLLVVLATDCEKVFALDGLSGAFRWCSRREQMNDAQYVLGATEEEIVLMGESIYWLDAETGRVKACYPERWVTVAQEQVIPHSAFGRGIWAGDAVWYPARDAVMKLKLDANDKVAVTTALSLPELTTPYGNLAYHDGRLYWAAENCVMAWNSPIENDSPKKPLGAAK